MDSSTIIIAAAIFMTPSAAHSLCTQQASLSGNVLSELQFYMFSRNANNLVLILLDLFLL